MPKNVTDTGPGRPLLDIVSYAGEVQAERSLGPRGDLGDCSDSPSVARGHGQSTESRSAGLEGRA